MYEFIIRIAPPELFALLPSKLLLIMEFSSLLFRLSGTAMESVMKIEPPS